mmetsp:Transcript_30951/g.77891  ORF Transcript_30951/g.77891 Transcript_30951/m.77891 type:complete len:458 (-) Transcript_30951:87-1460(-)
MRRTPPGALRHRRGPKVQGRKGSRAKAPGRTLVGGSSLRAARLEAEAGELNRLLALLGDLKLGVLAVKGGLDDEPQGLEHLGVVVDLHVGGGEERVAREDGVGARQEAQALLRVRERVPPGRQPDHARRHDDPRRGHAPHELQRGGGLEALRGHRRPLHRDQDVDGDALGVGGEGGERVEHAHAVLGRLPHADDAAAAHADAGVPHLLEGVEAVVVVPAGGDLWVVLGGRVDVVVVAAQAGDLELLRLLLGEHPQGRAHLHAEAADLGHHVQDALELLGADLGGAPPRSAHAKARAPRVLGAEGHLEDAVEVHELLRLEARVLAPAAALRAVGARLGAAPRLDGEQRALLHLAGVEVLPVHRRRLEDERHEGAVKHLLNLLAGPVCPHGAAVSRRAVPHRAPQAARTRRLRTRGLPPPTVSPPSPDFAVDGTPVGHRQGRREGRPGRHRISRPVSRH